jgi:hypothetical protein
MEASVEQRKMMFSEWWAICVIQPEYKAHSTTTGKGKKGDEEERQPWEDG